MIGRSPGILGLRSSDGDTVTYKTTEAIDNMTRVIVYATFLLQLGQMRPQAFKTNSRR